jgi:hypothetical protein
LICQPGYTADIHKKSESLFEVTDTALDALFAEFANKCARAFGACIMQRDDDPNDPPKLNEPSSYHVERIDEAKGKLESFIRQKSFNRERVVTRWIDESLTALDEHHQHVKQKMNSKKVFDRLIDKAKNWVAPSPEHEKFKTFLIEQLTMTNESDNIWSISYHTEQIKTSIFANPNYNAESIMTPLSVDVSPKLGPLVAYAAENIEHGDDANHDLHLGDFSIEFIQRVAEEYLRFESDELARLKREVEYHRKEYAKEVERCTKNNQWILDLKKSLI